MKINLFWFVILFFALSVAAFADAFVPEFNTMKVLRCDFEEIIYNQDNTVVSKSKQFRLYRLDDAYTKIYLQKEPIDKVLYYGQDRIEFNLQSMTDDYIMMSNTIINRQTGEYISTSEMTYDNPVYMVRYAKSNGVCRIVN